MATQFHTQQAASTFYVIGMGGRVFAGPFPAYGAAESRAQRHRATGAWAAVDERKG